MRLIVIGGMSEQIVTASKIAAKRGAKIFHVSDIKAALAALRSGKGADLLLVEVSQDIKSLTQSLKEERISIPVIACGIEADKEKAIYAIKSGAKEYISLPPDEEIISALLELITTSDKPSKMIAKSKEFQETIRIADQISPSEASVLITGESGVGKEVIAKYIHNRSKRSKRDLISLNCAAIPDNLLESELFGHEKGAFTGAVDRRIGKFEEAQGGTILLDEISEMELRLQAKLLRAIQEREIYRVGGSTPVKLDIRILATSNRNLAEEVKAGRFREDLFYRLNVIHLKLPSLKERKDDILDLAEVFLNKFSALNSIPYKQLSNEATEKLLSYNWPGNVRELENTIHRALLLSLDEKISPNDIILTLTDYNNSIVNNDNIEIKTLAAAEKETIENAWKKFQGNYDKTANVLGITIKVLKKKLDQYRDAS
ncbi:Transcriptional regulatory protein FlbD [Candidatus Jidaibacter acanthamoeba]|uniref:Putative response regulator NtrX-like n=1 Tax=Candidatus Jidaibacter acanthamoebae TaxID=86105 RepID=A0A0C1MTA1_9RICK|nr:sigma-54 dependent transcriptional regulator [Candidatus Jidaibacter acanthamoeba]KIE05327.1 Transcriptional regulatory protein FlbD [Candidatus Jidaibacter acanthamoeba]